MNVHYLKFPVFLFFLMASLTLGGCAFGTRTVVLHYPPEEPAEGLVASAEAEASVSAEPRSIVLSLSDKRTDNRRIGNVRNGFGMDTADVVTQDDVLAWVDGALAQELTRAGYRVIRPDSLESGGDAIDLKADITRVYCDVYMTYDGEVALLVNLESRRRDAVALQLLGEGSVGVNWAATAESYGESLALALQDVIAKLLAELSAY